MWRPKSLFVPRRRLCLVGAAAPADFGSDRECVLNQPAADLLHSQAFELVRANRTFNPGQGAPPQLLRPLRRHIDEQKAAGDRRCECHSVGATRACLIIVMRHVLRVPETAVFRKSAGPARVRGLGT